MSMWRRHFKVVSGPELTELLIAEGLASPAARDMGPEILIRAMVDQCFIDEEDAPVLVMPKVKTPYTPYQGRHRRTAVAWADVYVNGRWVATRWPIVDDMASSQHNRARRYTRRLCNLRGGALA